MIKAEIPIMKYSGLVLKSVWAMSVEDNNVASNGDYLPYSYMILSNTPKDGCVE